MKQKVDVKQKCQHFAFRGTVAVLGLMFRPYAGATEPRHCNLQNTC